MGAFVVCSRLLRAYLVNTARPFIFSTALPPYQVAWTSFLLERLGMWDDRRSQLARLSRLLGRVLPGGGRTSEVTHILPWVLGDNAFCLRAAHALRAAGFYCLPVRTPTVPAGTARIRFSLSAAMTEADLLPLITLFQTGEL